MKTSEKIVGILAGVAVVIAIIAIILAGHSSSGAKGISSPSTNFDIIGALSLDLGTNCNNYQSVLNGNCKTQLSAPTIPIVSGTTTPCAFQITATSSISNFTFLPLTGTSTSATLTLATSSTAFATTSLIAQYPGYVSLAQNAAFTWDPGFDNSVVYPGTWVVVGEAAPTSVVGGFVQAGRCTLITQSL